MTISMYQASVPILRRQLRALSNVLGKGATFASEQGIAESELIETRLAPDMFALTRQVQIATDMAKGCVARLAAIEAPTVADDETTIAALQGRIAGVIAFLETVPAEAVDGSEERDIILKTPRGDMTFKGQPYLLDWSIPNVMFHCTTAYDILRHKGVPLGKQDFLGLR